MQASSSAIVFWTAFGLACAWLLPRYYFGCGSSRTTELRITTLVIDVLVLLSLILTWVPGSRGGPVSGMTLLTNGHALMIAAVLCVVIALSLLAIAKNTALLKTGIASHLVATPLIFAALLRLLPGTFAMTFAEVAPVVAVLLLLCGNVTALLLWHRLQIEKTVNWPARSTVISGGVMIAVLALLVVFAVKVPYRAQLQNPLNAVDAVDAVRLLPEVSDYVRRVPGALVEFDHQDEDGFSVHVYEIKDGHSATFNWYTVDPTTGKASAMFDAVPDESGTGKQAQWTFYRHPSRGYALWYPATWILEDNDSAKARIRIDAPDNAATFIVSALGDDRLKKPDGFVAVLADIREGFAQDPRYTLEAYEEGKENGDLLAGVYIARGGFRDGDNTYRFKEMGTLFKDGRMFVTTAHIRSSATQDYGEIMDEMLGAFDPFGVGSPQPTLVLE